MSGAFDWTDVKITETLLSFIYNHSTSQFTWLREKFNIVPPKKEVMKYIMIINIDFHRYFARYPPSDEAIDASALK